MNLTFTAEEIAFRDQVRAFVDEKLPGDVARKVLEHKRIEKDDVYRWHRALYEKGWIAPKWPKAHGGAGWNPIQNHIFDVESAARGAPRLSPFGLNMIGPVLLAFANDEQKQAFLPGILSADTWWCQGYSEPGSGSDLASLKTRAERKGDSYIVNGQKTWTTHAHWADMIFCLVRTDSSGKKQEGISMLLIDMQTPGIEVRPIVTLDGEPAVNEVWFDTVAVPAGNLVGDQLYLNQGNFRFDEVTQKAGIRDNGSWSSGVLIDELGVLYTAHKQDCAADLDVAGAEVLVR